MKSLRSILARTIALGSAFMLLGAVTPNNAARAAATSNAACAAVSRLACETAAKLGRGMNFGSTLDAPRDGDYGVRLDPSWVDLVSKAGFTHVRLPVRWSNHAGTDEQAQLEPIFLSKVDSIIELIERAGLYIVLDMHNYRQLDGDPLQPHEARVEPTVLEQRAVNIWRQLAAHYKGRHPKMLFELYNEPHERLDEAAWNKLHPKLLAAVRASDRARMVLIGPGYWNAARALDRLEVPADRNVLIAVHVYEPHSFTHQNAWNGQYTEVLPCCSKSQRAEIEHSMQTALDWSHRVGHPVVLTEWGVNGKAPPEARASYARVFRDAAEARGFSWTWWDLAGEFGMYDVKTGRWDAALLNALVGR